MTKIPVNIREDFYAAKEIRSKVNVQDSSTEGFSKIMDEQMDSKKNVQTSTDKSRLSKVSQKNDKKADASDEEERKKDKATLNDDENALLGMNELSGMFNVMPQDVQGLQDTLENNQDLNVTLNGPFVDNSGMFEKLSTENLSAFEQRIMDVLQIDSESFQDVLSQLGLDAEDLLNEEALSKFVLASAGATDTTEFLTNEELLQANRVLQDELKDMKGILNQQIMQEMNVVQEESPEKGLRSAFDEMVEAKNTKVTDGEGVNYLNLDVRSGEGQEMFQNNTTDERKDDDLKSPKMHDLPTFANYTGNAQFTVDYAESLSAQNETGHVSYNDMQDMVMNQVTEQIKLQMKADTTEVNLRLQPETLGTIQIQISAKEGIMTAHFTASSDEIKAILETQMEILQQNLENQDIKVEAIEVSVQPEMYENDFSDQHEENRQNESSSNKKRHLTIDDIMSDSSSLSEEDKVVAEMMIANGNTVDYQA